MFGKEKPKVETMSSNLDANDTNILVNLTKKRANDIKNRLELDLRQLNELFKQQKQEIEERVRKVAESKVETLKDENIMLRGELEDKCKLELQECLSVLSKLQTRPNATIIPIKKPTDVDLESEDDWNREIGPSVKRGANDKTILPENDILEEEE